MDDHRSVDVKGRRIVPNAFTFHLSARDHAGFAEIEHALIHELGEAAREYARDEGYHFVGPVSVEIVVDNALKPGRFGIGSTLREGASAEQPAASAPTAYADSSFAVLDQPQVLQQPAAPDDSYAMARPAAYDPAPPAYEPAAPAPFPTEFPTEFPGEFPAGAPAQAAPAQPSYAAAPARLGAAVGRLQLPSGERVTVGHRVVSLGRLPECTVTLNDPNVSRRHAEIRPGTELTIVDLGSTNGTKVNGLRIDGERVLVDGDIISLGSSHLRFEASSASA